MVFLRILKLFPVEIVTYPRISSCTIAAVAFAALQHLNREITLTNRPIRGQFLWLAGFFADSQHPLFHSNSEMVTYGQNVRHPQL
jgi:hypothetical protein